MLFLILALWIFIKTPFGQNWIAAQVTKKFSKELQTKISIGHVDFSLFNRLHLEDFMVKDRSGDTLIYAGDLQVRITDWFFFKNKTELKYIGLENALIKFQRTDSVWNNQFLFDYFSSNDTSEKSVKGGINLDLKKVTLKNVAFVKKDAWAGEDMQIYIGALQLDANQIDLKRKIVDISSLTISDPIVALQNYKGNRQERTTYTSETPAPGSQLQWNRDNWIMQVANLNIDNGTFKTDKIDSIPLLSSFDGKHIDFNHINTVFTNLRWDQDTISAHLKLNTKERSGFEVKNMLADVKFTPREMTFNHLNIQTNKSNIKDYFSMSYADFSDMDDFVDKINMTGNFEGTEIESDDIAYFAPALSSWKKRISFKGNIRGPVNELIGKGLIVQAGGSTLLNGDISMTGLPDINQTFIDFKANDFRTTYRDAIEIIPQLRGVTNPNLRKIEYLHFTGSFTGFIHDFVTFGSIGTNLGTIQCDLNMKFPNREAPLYSGNISTDNFQLGTFLEEADLGAISLNGVVKGSGFSPSKRNTTFDGKIHYVDYNNYRYQKITLNGTLDKKQFDGVASIDDPNISLSLNGSINLNDSVPAFNFISHVANANLQKLNITKDSIIFNGKFNLDFAGNTLDNFKGTARISDATLIRNSLRLPFDSLIITSIISNRIKTITANSNEFDAAISGNFNIKDLPDAFLLFLNKYYPSYIKAPHTEPVKEVFTFDVSTRNINDLMTLFSKDLKGFDYSHVTGKVDLSDHHFDLKADVPNFSFKQYVFTNAQLKALGTLSKLTLSGSTGNALMNDTLNLPLTTFNIESAQDSSIVSITTGSNTALNKANINGMVHFYENGVKIRFDTTSFVLNGKTWNIEKNGELEFGNNSQAQGQLLLSDGEQEIKMGTEPSTNGNWNNLLINLKKVNLGDFSPLFLRKKRLEGLVSGTIHVEDPYKKFNVTSDINADQLRFDNDSLGGMTTHIEYNNETGELSGLGKNLDPDHKIDFNLHINLKDSLKARNNLISGNTQNYPIKFLEQFLQPLFSDVQGYITGPISMSGPLDELNFTGKARLHDAGLKVNFTQCFYKIKDTTIQLKPNEIDLDGIVLTDSATKNPIYLNGSIQHHSFKDMFYDLYVSTRKPNSTGEENNKPVLLLNTTAKDNDQFYGYVKGTGSFSLTGPQSEMFMQISAIASSIDSSYITLPPSRSRETGIADFLTEKKYGHEMSDSSRYAQESNILYDVDVSANPMVNFRMILDDLTGDEIKARGKGDLNIKAGSSEPLSLNGGFEIEDGSYLFTFQSFFKKPFTIKKGGNNYIKWNGDPYKARINFDAQYNAEKVSFSPLANSLPVDPNFAKVRGDVYVVASLTGDLFKPDIKFSLDFPSSSPAVTDPAFSFNIHQIEKNPNEMNKQVFYLIVLNTFAPSEIGSSSAATSSFNISEIATNTISGIFVGVVNSELNKILGKLLKNDKYRVNFSSSVYNKNIIDPNNKTALNLSSNINLSVGRSFFNNRFVITFGGGFEAPLQQSSIQQTIQLLPDVTMEWLINQSGTVRASFFYRENTDYLSITTSGGPARSRRTGASIAYRNEFDNLHDLFGRKNNKKQKAVSQKPEAEKEEKIPGKEESNKE
ncbi:MAG: translocation/assembly module TamB domain-containing protein [Bacteroidetes bacterium]|nr:translocation/assembly module TamB domain-containing protein [Bacteroidota bacterium]MBS1930409.1 translocation/assembly module TamB domain-containing protein [Bacteroidota bacterium]